MLGNSPVKVTVCCYRKKKINFINPTLGKFVYHSTHTHTCLKCMHTHKYRQADRHARRDVISCHVAAPGSSEGFGCPCSRATQQRQGGELAPLQPPVHAPYCGPCWTWTGNPPVPQAKSLWTELLYLVIVINFWGAWWQIYGPLLVDGPIFHISGLKCRLYRTLSSQVM